MSTEVVEKSRSPARQKPPPSRSGVISSSDATELSFPDAVRLKRARQLHEERPANFGSTDPHFEGICKIQTPEGSEAVQEEGAPEGAPCVLPLVCTAI
jgi:hypothetical protein